MNKTPYNRNLLVDLLYENHLGMINKKCGLKTSFEKSNKMIAIWKLIKKNQK